MSQPWTEQDTAAVVQAVAETKDPALAACAVIGAMMGVLEHYEGRESARTILDAMIARNFQIAANWNRREGGQ
ncbi:hypothetical protein V3589_14855 [Sinorhizobium fredii]|uniref:hypothetical protein n=1 Tax=Rhizobium fredii TaxID=380 RepID=UPI0030958368